jgi:hypothetical protein
MRGALSFGEPPAWLVAHADLQQTHPIVTSTSCIRGSLPPCYLASRRVISRRPGPAATPTQSRYSRHWAAAGGIGRTSSRNGRYRSPTFFSDGKCPAGSIFVLDYSWWLVSLRSTCRIYVVSRTFRGTARSREIRAAAAWRLGHLPKTEFFINAGHESEGRCSNRSGRATADEDGHLLRRNGMAL